MILSKNISRKILTSCFLAGCLEIYDFTVFGFLASIINRYYLVFLNENDALIITYALFGVGFLFRPFGALLFGYIGDKYGRKLALILSISIMGCSSLLMFLLPTYETIGVWSCYLIALIRIAQGISVGGEYSGAIIFAVEHYDKKSSGFVGSIVVSGCMSGVLLSTIVSLVLKNPILPDYAWRFAFLLGFMLSFIGYFIRKQISETPEFKKLPKRRTQIPILYGLKFYFLENLTTLFLAATNGINLYFMTVYIPNYLSKIMDKNLSYLAIITTTIMAISIPICGILSDKIGREKQLVFGLAALTIVTCIILPLIFISLNVWIITGLIVVHAVVASIQAGAMNTYIVEIFPVKCRFSCSGLSYGIGMGVIGGLTPMIAAIITNNFEHNIIILTAYITLVSFGAFILTLKTIRKKEENNYV